MKFIKNEVDQTLKELNLTPNNLFKFMKFLRKKENILKEKDAREEKMKSLFSVKKIKKKI